MTDEKLLPCRFCGNSTDFYYKRDPEPYDYLQCKQCGHDVAGYLTDYTVFVSAKILWRNRNEKNNPFLEERMTEIKSGITQSNCPLCDEKVCIHLPRILSRVKIPFVIGKYNMSGGMSSPDKIWIQKSNGEGMEVSIEKLEKLLDEFWEKEF